MNKKSQNGAILVCSNLSKTYQDGKLFNTVLQGVELQVAQGELLAIVGSSGSGKSTLLHLLGGLDKPSAGEVFYQGQNIHQLSPNKQAKWRNQCLGFVYQFHHLLSEFNALENVAMPLLIAGMNIKRATEKAQSMLTRVGLAARLHHRPSELSGGERQRVANKLNNIAQTQKSLQGIVFEGIDPNLYSSNIVKPSIYAGQLTDLTAGSFNIIIGQNLARELGVSVGDKVRVISARGSLFTPLGRMPIQRNFTVVGLFNVGSDVDNQLALMHIQDAGKLIRIDKEQITDLRLYLNDPFDIQSWTPPRLKEGQILTDWRKTHGELFAAVKMEKNMIWLLLCLIISVAAFNILSSSVMVVSDKNGEVAILKTLGISGKTLNLIFIIQGAWSGIIGALIGTGSGLLLSSYINETLSLLGLHLLSSASGGERVLPVLHEPLQILVIMFGAMLLSLLATLYPAYRAGKVSPVEALRYE